MEFAAVDKEKVMMKWPIAILLLAALAGRVAASPICTPSSPVGLPCTTGPITYDGAGNIWKIGNDVFRYYPVVRLKDATLQSADGTGQSYEYDAVGNLKKITYTQNGAPMTSVIDNDPSAATNHLGGATYDDAGDMTNGFGMSFNYDASGMATSASAGNGYTLEIYTAGDERIGTMQVSAPITGTKINLKPYVATWRLRGVDLQVLRELKETAPASGSATWTWTGDWVYHSRGQLLAEMLPIGANSETWRHFHLDHLGTPRLITDGNGSKVSVHHYYPFGEEISSIIGQTEVMKFTGHERDFLGGTITENRQYIDYMHARFGGPFLGRFLSVDPEIGDPRIPQSWNRYSYVLNNPMIFVDPTGRVPNCKWIGDAKDGKGHWECMEFIEVEAKDPGSGAGPSSGSPFTYQTRDSAARAAVQSICGASISKDKEYGGEILKMGDRFGFSTARKGNQHDTGKEVGQNNLLDGPNFMKMLPPPGVQLVGTYHTHGKESGRGDESISDTDRHSADLLNLAVYVGTPEGRVRIYDPRDFYIRDPWAEDFGLLIGTVPCK